MIIKGKAVRLSRPIQKLYPIEVLESSTDLPRSQEKQVERERTLQKRVIPSRAAALDAAYKNARNDEPAGRLVRLFYHIFLTQN